VRRVRRVRLAVGEKITAPDGNESRVLIRDTLNTDIVPGLEPQAGDDIVYKTRFSEFFETDLDARLRKLRDDTSDNHGLHDEYLCGFNRPGRDVQGLPMPCCWPTARRIFNHQSPVLKIPFIALLRLN
jgi:hypothetical protein